MQVNNDGVPPDPCTLGSHWLPSAGRQAAAQMADADCNPWISPSGSCFSFCFFGYFRAKLSPLIPSGSLGSTEGTQLNHVETFEPLLGQYWLVTEVWEEDGSTKLGPRLNRSPEKLCYEKLKQRAKEGESAGFSNWLTSRTFTVFIRRKSQCREPEVPKSTWQVCGFIAVASRVKLPGSLSERKVRSPLVAAESKKERKERCAQCGALFGVFSSFGTHSKTQSHSCLILFKAFFQVLSSLLSNSETFFRSSSILL